MNFITASWNRKLYNVSLFALVALLAWGCEPEELELNEADRDARTASELDTFSVFGKTVPESPLSVSNFSIDRIGELTDPEFGRSRAEVAFNLDIPDEWSGFGEASTPDKAYFELSFHGTQPFYGEDDAPMKFTLHRLGEFLREEPYNNDASLEYQDAEAGIAEGQVDHEEASLSIELNSAFAESFMDKPDEIFQNTESFKEAFEGFYIKARSGGRGAIYYFDLRNDISGLTFIYNDSEDTVTFPVNDESHRVNFFDFEPLEDIDNQLDSDEWNFSSLYLHPLSSIKGNIRIPYLNELVEQGYVVIHQAELIIPYKEPSEDMFALPPRLLIQRAEGEDLKNESIEDQFHGGFGGSLNRSENHYRFTVTRYVQQLIKSYRDEPGYVSKGINIIIPSESPAIANRAIVKANNEEGIKLRIRASVPQE